MPIAPLVERLLRGEPAVPVETPRAWWDAHRARTAELSPFERALVGGGRADRVGWAFAAGYEAALVALVPDRDGLRSAALCATEIGGAHPAKITTRLEGDRLTGDKTFVTLGDAADDLLVLARSGTGADGRAELVLAELARDAEGVSLTLLPDMPIVPEIPHASVKLEGARVRRVLPGDGWVDYVRPFRTVEDLHVHAAFLSWLIARGAGWRFPRELLERGAQTLFSLAALAGEKPDGAGVHVGLAGALASSRALVAAIDEAGWAEAPAEDKARFERDRPLLDVAGRARAERLARAWARLAGEAG